MAVTLAGVWWEGGAEQRLGGSHLLPVLFPGRVGAGRPLGRLLTVWSSPHLGRRLTGIEPGWPGLYFVFQFLTSTTNISCLFCLFQIEIFSNHCSGKTLNCVEDAAQCHCWNDSRSLIHKHNDFPHSGPSERSGPVPAAGSRSLPSGHGTGRSTPSPELRESLPVQGVLGNEVHSQELTCFRWKQWEILPKSSPKAEPWPVPPQAGGLLGAASYWQKQ